MQIPLIRLECGCNSYDWGKIGQDSMAAKLAAATNFTIQDDKPYAELWMGTHPSLPSKDVETQRSLLDLVQDNKALMSTEISDRYGNKLPFLFKVLSMNKALSIQAHPNKKLAEKLHSEDPEHYPDDNHKPEMTVAITPFEGLCGFRPLAEIAHFIKTVAPLRELIGDSKSEHFVTTVKGKETSTDPDQISTNKQVLQNVFSSLMENALASTSALTAATDRLVADAKSLGASFAGGGGPSPTSGQQLADLIQRAHGQFPNDVGLLVFFFLNYVQLSPGEAMFLRADDIHAYLQGDIVECMASSDNVVRAGFTPKFKDVRTLAGMLTYNYAPIEEQKMAPEEYMFVKLNAGAYSSSSEVVLYDPPIEEFAVVMTRLRARGAKATFDPVDGPSIIVCTQGEGTIAVGSKVEEMKAGFVYFVGATAELVLESKGSDEFVTFKAFCELNDDNEGMKNGKASI